MPGLFDLGVRELQKSFFDREIVKSKVGTAKIKVLSKFGAFVRTLARSSMRPARQMSLGEMSQEQIITYEEKKRYAAKMGGSTPKRPTASSRPGEPPRTILGLIKQFLFFSYDKSAESVVIGPARLNGKPSGALQALEEGGKTVLWNGKTVNIAARPFMHPAFEAELPKVARLWQDVL